MEGFRKRNYSRCANIVCLNRGVHPKVVCQQCADSTPATRATGQNDRLTVGKSTISPLQSSQCICLPDVCRIKHDVLRRPIDGSDAAEFFNRRGRAGTDSRGNSGQSEMRWRRSGRRGVGIGTRYRDSIRGTPILLDRPRQDSAFPSIRFSCGQPDVEVRPITNIGSLQRKNWPLLKAV